MKDDDNDFNWFPTHWKVIFGVLVVALVIYFRIVGTY